MPNRLHNPEQTECKGCKHLSLTKVGEDGVALSLPGKFDELERICGFCKRNGWMQDSEKNKAEDKYEKE